jgi:hypothetical protein
MKNSKKKSLVKDAVSALQVKSSVKAGLSTVGSLGGLGGGFCLACGLGGVAPKPIIHP